jgi:predicted  nucleic acid-binding Zn-ribbon protein
MTADSRRRASRAWWRLLPVALGSMAIGATVMMVLELGWVSLRVAVFCGVVAAFATSFLLQRYERAAMREYAVEQEARRRQMEEVGGALGDLRDRVRGAEGELSALTTVRQRLADLATIEGRLVELAGRLETTRSQSVDSYAVQLEVGAAVRTEAERLRGEADRLRGEIATLSARQDALEQAVVALRDDVAHELSAIAGTGRQPQQRRSHGGYAPLR